MHRVTSREFGQNVSRSKHLAREGPLVITDRGEPAFVLLNIKDYRAIVGHEQETSLLEAMHAIASPGKGIELVLPERARGDFESRVPDFIGEKAD